MQKPLRPGINPHNADIHGKSVFSEALNPDFGFYYTVRKSLYRKKTAYQEVELVDTDEFGKVLLLDGITQLGEKNEFCYHEPMVHPALCSHPKPESVLIIGGGDGCLLREVLRYPCVKRVDLAELDGEVVEFSSKQLKKLNANSFGDSRLSVSIVDGREYARSHPAEFDVVIMDMTDPFGPSRMLYTRDFFRIVRQALRNGRGVFTMHSESPVTRPKAFACINRTLGSVFGKVNMLYTYIQMYGALWSIAVCSTSIDISTVSPGYIDRRLKKYGITDLKAYNGAIHRAMQTPFPFVEKILQKPSRIITDRRPDFPDDFIP